MQMLVEALKEQKFDGSIDSSELFQILSSDSKKEKVIAMALEFIERQ